MQAEPRDCVLVTGGSGMVGRAIKCEIDRETSISERYHFLFVSTEDADLTSYEQTGSLFTRYRPSYVINLAAKVGGLYSNMSDNRSFYKVNNSINENVLSWCHKFKVKKCISCLSTCIFPNIIEYPLDETKIHQGPPHPSNWGYSMAKRQVDLLNQKYNQASAGQSLFTAVIPTNIFGKHDNFSLEQSHVIPGLVHRAYQGAIRAKSAGLSVATLQVYGSGKPLRQFIYAPDLAKLILWTLEKYNDPKPLIMCPDEKDEISVGQVAMICCEELGNILDTNISVALDQTKSDGQFKKTASNRKLRALYPEFQFTPLRVALREVIQWFCINYPDIRL